MTDEPSEVPNFGLLNNYELAEVARALGEQYRPAKTTEARYRLRKRLAKQLQSYRESGKIPWDKGVKISKLNKSLLNKLGLEGFRADRPSLVQPSTLNCSVPTTGDLSVSIDEVPGAALQHQNQQSSTLMGSCGSAEPGGIHGNTPRLQPSSCHPICG
jgi:hypothetical protein